MHRRIADTSRASMHEQRKLVKTESRVFRQRRRVGDGIRRLIHATLTFIREAGIVILLVIYLLMGAFVLWCIEGPQEAMQIRDKTSKDTLVTLRDYRVLDNELDYCTSLSDIIAKLQENKTLSNAFCALTSTTNRWTFYGAFVYAVTVLSTIGYGTVAPQTVEGQAFTIVYSLLGIPLLFLVLARVGNLCCLLLYYVYQGMRTTLCGYMKLRNKELEKLAIEERDFPVWIALVVCLGWMFFVAGILCYCEESWNYFTSIYFTFISTSTIGLGDVMPDSDQRMILYSVLIVIGLALVSMWINLIQEKIELASRRVMARIQDKYKETTVEEQGDMDDEAAWRNIDQWLRSETDMPFMHRLIRQDRRRQMLEQWQSRARMRCHGTQTTNDIVSKCVQVTSDNADAVTQCGSYVLDLGNPYASGGGQMGREVKLIGRQDVDEYRNLMRHVNGLLTDCQDLLTTSSGTEPTTYGDCSEIHSTNTNA